MPRCGNSDYVGIVEKCEGGTTIFYIQEGGAIMCRVMEDMRNETAREERIARAQRLLKLGKLS